MDGLLLLLCSFQCQVCFAAELLADELVWPGKIAKQCLEFLSDGAHPNHTSLMLHNHDCQCMWLHQHLSDTWHCRQPADSPVSKFRSPARNPERYRELTTTSNSKPQENHAVVGTCKDCHLGSVANFRAQLCTALHIARPCDKIWTFACKPLNIVN